MRQSWKPGKMQREGQGLNHTLSQRNWPPVLDELIIDDEYDDFEDGRTGFIRVEVVTASLGFLTNFEDVYKLWVFVSKFLNPAFIREGSLLLQKM
ncbi:hypothetical protein Leryth_007041 [Lithospermum erythrorhizon]|nr:hypothetical protein Leryth_007041 [Lithospermum erythrorhizon]